MNKTDLLQRIMRARDAINAAETELDDAFKLMQASSVGNEKVLVSQVLGDAFEKLRAANASLVKLQESE